MSDDLEDGALYRRRGDSVINYRLDRIETAVEKLTENQEILTRVEANSIHMTRIMAEFRQRQDEHGKALDSFAERITATESKQESLTWAVRLIIGGIVLGVISGLVALL